MRAAVCTPVIMCHCLQSHPVSLGCSVYSWGAHVHLRQGAALQCEPEQSRACNLTSVCLSVFLSLCVSGCDFNVAQVFLGKWVCLGVGLWDNKCVDKLQPLLKPHPVNRKCANVSVKHNIEERQNAGRSW